MILATIILSDPVTPEMRIQILFLIGKNIDTASLLNIVPTLP